MKELICFIRRSTLASVPVFNKVVMAKVAMDLFGSVIKFSISRLHCETEAGWDIASLLSVFIAAKRRVDLGLTSMSWRAHTAMMSSWGVVFLRSQIAREAS